MSLLPKAITDKNLVSIVQGEEVRPPPPGLLQIFKYCDADSKSLADERRVMMREIKNIGIQHIEDYLSIYWNAYPAHAPLDDNDREHYRRKIKTDMMKDKDSVEFVGLFEDGILASTMKIVNFSMNIYGKMQHATGLMSLAVHPLYKRRGIALDMIRYFEKYTRDAGALAALLLPFDIAFYRRLGYGLGSKLEEYHIPTAGLPKCGVLPSLHILERGELPKVLRCYKSYVEKNHGMLEKTGEEIRAMESDTQVHRIGYIGEDGELEGYLAYRFTALSNVNYTMNRIDVEEMIYENGRVLRGLLGFLRMQADQAQEVILRSGEEGLYHLLEDPQDVSGNYIPFGYLQTNIAAVGTMYKLPDPARFIAATAYRRFPAEEMIVRFEYEDEISHRQETLTIAFIKENLEYSRWEAVDECTETDAVIKCRQGVLASLLLGSCTFSAMVRLGAVEISDNTYTQTLDHLLYYPQRPWTNTDY